MKKTIFTILFIAAAPFFCFTIPWLTCLPLIKADGKTFGEIISNGELVLRFFMSALIFGTLVYLFARFIVIRFFNYISDFDAG